MQTALEVQIHPLPEKGSMIDTFSTADVAAAIKQAKASADCVIFSANWGKTEEPMPTEYEKEWASFLMSRVLML